MSVDDQDLEMNIKYPKLTTSTQLYNHIMYKSDGYLQDKTDQGELNETLVLLIVTGI